MAIAQGKSAFDGVTGSIAIESKRPHADFWKCAE
jgi:hypothetical protein